MFCKRHIATLSTAAAMAFATSGIVACGNETKTNHKLLENLKTQEDAEPNIDDKIAKALTWEALPTTGEPDARQAHTAIWTGEEMIVWGGIPPGRGSAALATGGRYNVKEKTWAATATDGAPSARSDHEAVWTGDEMLIWGGSDGSAGGGGRYDPTTDSWTAISTTGAPTQEAGATAVWTGTKMITLGVNADAWSGGIYDPSTDSWETMSVTGAPAVRSGHRAVWTGDEMLIWGGSTEDARLATGGAYDPESDTWRLLTDDDAPAARSDHEMIVVDNQVFVWGGDGSPDVDDAGRTGAIYDPASDAWTAVAVDGSTELLTGHSLIWTGEYVVTWGFALSGGAGGGIYDVADDSWRLVPFKNAPADRTGHSAVWTGEEMLIWGGALGLSEPGGGGILYCCDKE